MTNEAIIQQFEPNIEYPSYYHESNVFEAMDAARRDEAIRFNRWRDGQGWECTLHDDEGVKHWQIYGEGEIKTDEQLYSLFKNSDNGK